MPHIKRENRQTFLLGVIIKCTRCVECYKLTIPYIMFVTMQLVRVNSDETSLYVQSDHGRLHSSIVSQAMDKYAVKLTPAYHIVFVQYYCI